MKKYEYLFFDLDGTITDSFLSVANSFRYALESYGIKVNDINELRPVLGPPLRTSFETMFGFSPDESVKAVEKYRERYVNHYISENRIYDGVRELLTKLYEDGYKLVLATSKPEKFALNIMKHFELDKYFHFITGASMDKSRDTKEKVLEYILNCLKISDKSKILMIGDRKFDLDGAAFFGIDAAGVLYGYGTREELLAHSHVYIAESTDDLYEFIIS